MDGTGFLLLYLKLASHLVVSASFKGFGETVGVMGKIYKRKKRLFRSSRAQPPLLVFNSDLKLRATETLI